MNIFVLDTSFQKVFVLDSFESLIWVDKFSEPGTFELYTPVTKDILTYMVKDYYIVSSDSEHVMIIEDFTLESNLESGDHIKVIGRSLESILDRRVIWEETVFAENHNLQNAIRKLIDRSMINTGNGELAKRKISNFKLAPESTDTSIKNLKLPDGAQYKGNTLLEVVQSLCTEYKIGFKVTLSDENKFVFSLYNGVDRSYKQNALPYVVFRPSFDNVISSDYKEENSKVKNVAHVIGAEKKEKDDEGEEVVVASPEVTVGTASGLKRREIHVDGSSISWESEEEDDEGHKIEITEEEYDKLLTQKGKSELAEKNKNLKSFDGKCETTLLYRYGRDFFMGDILQVANEYGIESASRITEFTWNYSSSGFETYPTFTAVEEEEENS